jgi:hypothetical protein
VIKEKEETIPMPAADSDSIVAETTLTLAQECQDLLTELCAAIEGLEDERGVKLVFDTLAKIIEESELVLKNEVMY